MTAKPDSPRTKGVGDQLDDVEAMLLEAADRINEPGPALINTLKPVLWPDVAREEIEVLARGVLARGNAKNIDVARGRALLQLERRYAERFAQQVYVRVMGVPVVQPRPPVPSDEQSTAMAKLVVVFANGSASMLSAIAEEAYRYYRLSGLAEVLVMQYGAQASEVVPLAVEAGDEAFAARIREKLAAAAPLLDLDAAYQAVVGHGKKD